MDRHDVGGALRRTVADAMLAEIILNPERLLDLLGKGSVSADPSPPSGLAAPFAANSLGSAWQTWLNSDCSGRNFYVAVPILTGRSINVSVFGSDWSIWIGNCRGLELPESLAMDFAQELVRARSRR